MAEVAGVAATPTIMGVPPGGPSTLDLVTRHTPLAAIPGSRVVGNPTRQDNRLRVGGDHRVPVTLPLAGDTPIPTLAARQEALEAVSSSRVALARAEGLSRDTVADDGARGGDADAGVLALPAPLFSDSSTIFSEGRHRIAISMVNVMFESLRPALEASGVSRDPKRQRVEALILETITTLDPSGANTKRYRTLFESWSDTQFRSFMVGMREGRIKLVLYVPNLKINLKLKDIFAAAHALDLTLFERLRLWDSTTQRYYVTPQEYPVLQLPVRRLKQYLMSKISVPESDTKIDAFSGQVTRPDKGASISAVEMQTILSKGLKTSISELIRIRGGDIAAYSEFKSQLIDTGAASMNMVSGDSRARSSVILGTYLRAAHVGNNL